MRFNSIREAMIEQPPTKVAWRYGSKEGKYMCELAAAGGVLSYSPAQEA